MSVEVSNDHEKSPSRFSWLKPKQSEKLDSVSESESEKRTSSDLRVSTPVEPPKPVSLIGLFRYLFHRLIHIVSSPLPFPASPPALSSF